MLHRLFDPFSRITTLIIGVSIAFLVILIVLFPDGVFQASLQGLTIWWNIVFPALLPFLVLSEILIAYGIVHLCGVLFEPFMRIVFGIPGIGGWVVAMGFAAGYPTGAKMTSQLREQQQLTRCEGERLLSLSHTSNPVFIMSVVAVGFFHHAELGFILASVHFISALIVGLMMRLHTDKAMTKDHLSSASPSSASNDKRIGLLQQAIASMHEAHQRDGRTFGKLLGDAVSSAITTLLIVGGYMMIFSVIIKVITLSSLDHIWHKLIHVGLIPFDVPQGLDPYLLPGLLEVNLGSYAISQWPSSSLVWQSALIGAALAWSGLSMHAQVKTLIGSSDLRYRPFLISRLLHAGTAFILTFVLWKPLNQLSHKVIPSFILANPSPSIARFLPSEVSSRGLQFIPLGAMMVAFVLIIICISAFLILLEKFTKSS